MARLLDVHVRAATNNLFVFFVSLSCNQPSVSTINQLLFSLSIKRKEKKRENAQHNFPEAKVMSLNCFFCVTNREL